MKVQFPPRPCLVCGKGMDGRRTFCGRECTLIGLRAASGIARAVRWTRRRPSRRKPAAMEPGSRLIRRRLEILEKHGATSCARCGLADPRVLVMDHVNGDGHRDGSPSRSRKPRWMDEGLASGRLQPLCMNCNWIKRLERQEHPRSPAVGASVGVG